MRFHMKVHTFIRKRICVDYLSVEYGIKYNVNYRQLGKQMNDLNVTSKTAAL